MAHIDLYSLDKQLYTTSAIYTTEALAREAITSWIAMNIVPQGHILSSSWQDMAGGFWQGNVVYFKHSQN